MLGFCSAVAGRLIVALLTFVLTSTGLTERSVDRGPRTSTAVVTLSFGQDTAAAAPRTPAAKDTVRAPEKPPQPPKPRKPVKISISDEGITVGDEDGTKRVILELDTEKLEQMHEEMQRRLEGLDESDLIRGIPESLAIYLQRDEDGGYVRIRGDAVVRFGNDIRIRRHELVQGDVIAILGDIEIEGKVRGNVVSVLGSTELSETAIVNGDVVTVLGEYSEHPGARVRGETVTVGAGRGTPDIVFPFFPAGHGILRAAGKVVGFIIGALLLMLVIYLLPDRMRRAGDYVFGSFFKSLGVGFLAVVFGSIIVGVIAAILAITIIGIPVAILVALTFAALLILGYFTSAFALGRLVCRRFDVCGSSAVAHGIVGLFLLLLLGMLSAVMWINPFLVPLRVLLGTLGNFVSFLAVLTGTGSLIISRMGMRTLEQRPETAVSAGPPE